MTIIAFKTPNITQNSCHIGLGVTASNLAEMLTEHGHEAQAVPVIDGYYIRDGLRQGKWPGVTHFVMCAPFFDTPFLTALCEEFTGVQFAVVFHSNVGFLGVDNWSMGVLGEQLALQHETPNFHVAGNSAKFCRAVNEGFGAPCTLLPNLYFLHGPIERLREPWKSGKLLIGAFGATRVLKNLPTAAWAAMIISRRLNTEVEFWVSQGRSEGSGSENVMESIRRLYAHSPAKIRLVESSWANWLEFRRHTVRRMNLLMQPSFTESFNGVTADGVGEGVPSVVGEAIDWVPQGWVANADDAVDVASVGIKLLRDCNAPRNGYRSLVEHNKDALRNWRLFIGDR